MRIVITLEEKRYIKWIVFSMLYLLLVALTAFVIAALRGESVGPSIILSSMFINLNAIAVLEIMYQRILKSAQRKGLY